MFEAHAIIKGDPRVDGPYLDDIRAAEAEEKRKRRMEALSAANKESETDEDVSEEEETESKEEIHSEEATTSDESLTGFGVLSHSENDDDNDGSNN